MTATTIRAALNAGLRRALTDDSNVVLIGEDIGRLGGVFRVTDGLQDEFGPRRVIDAPLAEGAIIGTAIGLAYRGFRPVVEIQFDGFVFPAMDQIMTQLAKLHYRTGGHVRFPVTVRIPFGGGVGAVEHHSESPEAYFAHTAGLRVVTCATPQDAYDMLLQSISSDDPVVFLEPKRRYHFKGELDDSTAARTPHPLHAGRVLAAGSDATLVVYGALVQTALDAAHAAAAEGISLEVIDLRTLSPVDYPLIEDSVRRTGRLVVAHEAPYEGGLGSSIVATITDRCFEYLEAPPTIIAGFDTPYPPAKLERHYLPDLDRILDGIDRVLGRPHSGSGEP